MTNSAIAVATDKVVDPEVLVTRKSYDIKMKHYFVQTINEVITSGKSCCAACAYDGLVPLYYHCWKRLTM